MKTLEYCRSVYALLLQEWMFAMHTQLRFDKIMGIVKEERVVSVASLSKRLYVSPSSIRRDLSELDQRGMLRRTYGGAVSKDSLEKELPVDIRMNEQKEAKITIARQAATLVVDNDFVFMDSSTTTFYMAQHLHARTGVTMFTNGARMAMELVELPHARVYCTGGRLRPYSLSFVGESAKTCLQQHNVNKVFFSCASIDITCGITATNEEECTFRRFILDKCKNNILLCDSTKFDQISFCKISGFEHISCLITEKEPSDVWKKTLAGFGVSLMYPGSTT